MFYYYKTLRFFLIIVLSFLLAVPVIAQNRFTTPSISIIFDDIGYRRKDDLNAIAIPGSLAYAIMPHSPHANSMAELISSHGKEVLVHLPMEAEVIDDNRFLGPGALTLDMTKDKFLEILEINLHSLPEAVGVNNHMGSLLTQNPDQMSWLMEYLKRENKFYIDSVTSRLSVASIVAKNNNIPYLRRDIFLDNHKDIRYIKLQFAELIKIAKRRGKAVAIGHPFPQTIAVLTEELKKLDKNGVKLISLSEMLNLKGAIYKRHVLLSR